MTTHKTIKARIAVMVDMDGNYSAAGFKGASNGELLEMASESDDLGFGLRQVCYITVDVPLPRPAELKAAITETETLKEEEGAA